MTETQSNYLVVFLAICLLLSHLSLSPTQHSVHPCLCSVCLSVCTCMVLKKIAIINLKSSLIALVI